MKNLVFIFLLFALKAASQTAFPLYLPGSSNTDSIKQVVNVNGSPRQVYNIDLTKFQAAKTAHDTATILRLLIPTNNNQLTNGAGFITTSALSPYLTSATAASTYQPIGSYLTNVTSLISAGTNVTVTGGGTSASPYVINSTASGGGTVDTVNYIATKTDLSGKRLGILYNKNSWASAADFTQVGTNTLAFTGNKINVSGASKAISATLNTSNTTLPTVLRITSYGGTMLEKYKFVAKIKVNQAPSATSYGFSTGTYSISSGGVSNAMGYFNMSTATGTGTVSILAGTTNATAAISTSALTFSQNDYILLTTERTPDKLTVTAQNITAGGEVSASYAWDATAVSNFLLPNTSNFAIGNMGGSYIVDSIGISSNETKGANLMLVGDSKMAGYVTPFEGRIGSILDKTYIAGTITSSGQGDRTADVLNHIPEIIALAPKQVFLSIGRNDIANAVSSATWQANLNSIVSQLQTAGISVIVSDGLYETTASQTALITYIQSTFPNNYIPTYSATTGAANLSSDNIHLNFSGHKLLADVIYSSPLIADYGKYTNGKIQNTALNYTSNNHYYNGTIYDLGRGYTPDVVNGGDIVIRSGSGLTSAFGVAAQKTRIEMGSNIVLRTYLGLAGTTNSYEFYTGGATTGTQTKALVITNKSNVYIGTGTAGANAGSGDVIVPVNGAFASSNAVTVGQEARIIPRSTNGHTEFRNYEAAGRIKAFVSGGTAGSQFEAWNISPTGAVILFTTTEPATPAAGSVAEWWDGTNKKWKKSDGTTGVIY